MHQEPFNRAGRPSARKQRAWAADNPGNAALRTEAYRAVRTLAGPRLGPGGGRVLDAGCGTGWWLHTLLGDGHPPATLTGCDLDSERARAAGDRAPGAAVSAADIRALPYPSASFDVVLFMTVLSSLASAGDQDEALHEARRVLAPDGCMLIWEPRVPTPWNRSTRFVGRRRVEAALGSPVSSRSLTVVPPLARRVASADSYESLARRRSLHTHRLLCWPGI